MPRIETHESFDARSEVKAVSDRSFGFTVAGFLCLLGLWPLFRAVAPHWPLLLASAALVGVALAAPKTLHPFNALWLRIGLTLGKIMTPVVLGLIFFTTVAPIGLLMRAFGKDPLRLRRDPSASSYWIARDPPGPSSDSMKWQF
jgi:hypothetical protein